MKIPKRLNYLNGIYGDISYTKQLNKYITYLENKNQVLQLQQTGVVGRSEQYHCELYDFGRRDKPCDKQCDGCKAMNLD